MTKLLEYATWPARMFWRALKVMIPFRYANVWAVGLVFFASFSLFRGLIYYPVTQDPTMPLGLVNQVWVELWFLPFPAHFLFSAIALVVLLPLFAWAYYNLLPSRRKDKKSFPLTSLRMALICTFMILYLGWTVNY